MEWSFASLFTSIRKCCTDFDVNSFCFLQEKIIYPLKGIRLLCIVFPHLVSLIPPSEHLSICNQHTMTLTNNNWTTTPHHNVVLITYITSYNAINVEQIHRAVSSLSRLTCFNFPSSTSAVKRNPCWAQYNPKLCLLLQFWSSIQILALGFNFSETDRCWINTTACRKLCVISAVFVMLIILYWRDGQQSNSVVHLLVTLYATLPATREIWETYGTRKKC